MIKNPIPTLERICLAAYGAKETVYQSYEMTKYASHLTGCIVECGVAAGSQIAAMAYALEEIGQKRTIWGFDSFEGIPMAGPNDELQPGIGEIKHDKFAPIEERLVSSGITSHAIDVVMRHFLMWGITMKNVRLIPGWFQNSLPSYHHEVGKIALLRLDGDLYESTFVSMKYLYPKVVPGGIVIIDDYALPGCKKAIFDYLGESKTEQDMIELPDAYGVHWFTK